MRRIASFRAGRRRDGSLVIVSQCRDRLSPRVRRVILAGIRPHTCCCAGCGFRHLTGIPIMAGGFDHDWCADFVLALSIAEQLAAAAALPVGLCAVLGAGCRDFRHGIQLMRVCQLRNTFCPSLSADRAGEGLNTLSSLGRLLRDLAGVPFVAERIHIAVHIGILAAGTRMRRIASFRAGRRRHNGLIIVSQRLHNLSERVRCVILAGKNSLALFSAGRGLRHLSIVPVVTGGIDYNR